jgi:hypothetical protein
VSTTYIVDISGDFFAEQKDFIEVAYVNRSDAVGLFVGATCKGAQVVGTKVRKKSM